MRAVRLRTSYLKNPMGMDITKPHFYWNCEGGEKQTAYEIMAECNGKEIFHTGKVVSDAMTHIPYAGETLQSRDIVTWKVRLWDEKDQPGAWNSASFEMGLLEESDWLAKWISGDYKPKKKERYPVDCFKKDFQTKKEIKKARLYASARGLYDVCINGSRLTDFILAPGMTDYRKRIQYQTYDVTGLLQDKNTLELRLADGWYRGSSAAYGVTEVYGNQTSLIAQLEVIYTDGSKDVIATDGSFAWSNDGPIRFADLKDGEIYDAEKKPSYQGKAVEIMDSAKNKPHLQASNNVAVQEKETFQPKLLIAKDGTKVLDFEQNMAGYIAFSIHGEKGQKLVLKCGEVLDEEGRVDLSGIQETRPAKGWSQMDLIKKLMGAPIKGATEVTPKQEINFVCSGSEDSYKTSFAVFGFRYAEVETDIAIKPENFTAIAVYSDMETVGEFNCSNPMINQLYQNTLWSMKGNFLDLPTDCPTRERLGWTGDAQIFFYTGAYMMDTAAFFKKWLLDMQDAQYKNGTIPAVLPYQGVDMMYKATGVSVGWADAVYLIPYRYYKRYGDLSVLEDCWDMIEKYAAYLWKHLGMTDKKAAKENPYNAYTYEKGVHLGEWLEPEKFRDKEYGAQAKHPEECTAYFYLSMTTIGEIAGLLGKKEIEAKCQEYAKGAKKAYHSLIVESGKLRTNRQAKLVRPLALGLLDGAEKEDAQKWLVEAVKDYDYCVGTGFLSTPFLLPVLAEAGEVETAYRMLENTKKPGWLGEVADHATTVWENWEGDASRNHYSPGAVCEWLWSGVCGIQLERENHFVIAPLPGGSLTDASASYQSIYGKVMVGWKKEGEKTCYQIEIPANTTAELRLPDGRVQTLTAGNYEF